MPAPSVTITLFEAVTYLRGQSASQDARGGHHRRRNLLEHPDTESQPSQLRGLVTLFLPKSSRIKSVELTFSGMGRTDWPEGIGNNRIELAETTSIFKESVTLFNAKAEDAPAPPLRRAHSVGPGIGLSDDVDWGMIERQSGRSSGTVTPNGPADQRRADDRSASRGPGAGSSSQKDKDTAAALARSVGKAAAKVLPPTLREMTGASGSSSKNASKSNVPTRRVGLEHLTSNGIGESSRPMSRSPSQIDSFTPGSSPPRSRSIDPPPEYRPDPPAPVASTSMIVPPSILPFVDPNSVLPAQSVSAAGPHGRSILHSPRRAREPNAAASPNEQQIDSIANDSSSSTPDQRGRPRGPSEYVVRFDPRDVSTASTAERAESSTRSAEGSDSSHTLRGRPRGASASNATGVNASGWPVASSQYREPSASAPSSRRASLDLLKLDKGKGKAGKSNSGESVPTLKGQKKQGLKGLLGGLIKDEKDKDRDGPGRPSLGSNGTQATSRRSHDAFSPHQPPQLYQNSQCDWREFKKGTYTYSISFPLPANLPPTIHADFGSNTYTLKAVVKRSGPLTPNLSCEKEVVLVHAPDEEGTEETEAIIVERTWDDSMTYRVFVSGRSFACGSNIPLWMKFIPLGEKVRIWRFTAVLEEKTHYYAKKRKIARHEIPRKWTLLKLVSPEGADGSPPLPLLPIISDSSDALRSSPLGMHAIAAAALNMPADSQDREIVERHFASSSRQSTTMASLDEPGAGDESRQNALASLLDPAGPWEFAMDLPLPGKDSRINITTDHSKSSITVSHILRLTFRVERPAQGPILPGGKPKLYDIVIESPVTINHSHAADAWLSLPNYWSVASREHSTFDQDGTPTGVLNHPHSGDSEDYFAAGYGYRASGASTPGASQHGGMTTNGTGGVTPGASSSASGRTNSASTSPVTISNLSNARTLSPRAGSASSMARSLSPANLRRPSPGFAAGRSSSPSPGPLGLAGSNGAINGPRSPVVSSASPTATSSSPPPRTPTTPASASAVTSAAPRDLRSMANQWLSLSMVAEDLPAAAGTAEGGAGEVASQQQEGGREEIPSAASVLPPPPPYTRTK